MGAVETAMIDAAYAQVGKSFGFPTHAYLGASDAKIVDYQAGMESSTSAMIGALAGINMISGPGMLDFLACQSPEKLLIDAEAIAMARRLLAGIQAHTNPFAVGMYEGIDFKGDFLKQRLTGQLFKKEQYLPSPVIDRGSIRTWHAGGKTDTFARARSRLQELLGSYQPPELPEGQRSELTRMVAGLAARAGMDKLPVLDH
jgi:trimethylamine--corrinoid protein Co-methyltransferase